METSHGCRTVSHTCRASPKEGPCDSTVFLKGAARFVTRRSACDRKSVTRYAVPRDSTADVLQAYRPGKVKVKMLKLQEAVPEATPRGARKRQREVSMVEKRAQAVELRRAGLTYERIGQALGCSEANAHKLVKSALRGIVRAPGDALIEAELAALEDLERKTKMVLDAAHPLVQAGNVVHDIVRDTKGEPVIDPRTNQPLRLPLHDSRPVLAAIAQLLQIHESRRRLLGVDAPKRLAMTDAAGFPVPVTGMSEERFEAAVAEVLARHRRGRSEVVDVTPTDSQSASFTKGQGDE